MICDIRVERVGVFNFAGGRGDKEVTLVYFEGVVLDHVRVDEIVVNVALYLNTSLGVVEVNKVLEYQRNQEPAGVLAGRACEVENALVERNLCVRGFKGIKVNLKIRMAIEVIRAGRLGGFEVRTKFDKRTHDERNGSINAIIEFVDPTHENDPIVEVKCVVRLCVKPECVRELSSSLKVVRMGHVDVGAFLRV